MRNTTVLLLLAASLGSGCSEKPPEKPLTDLLSALKAKDEAARIVAAEKLGERGPTETGQAVEALMDTLTDRSPYVRRAAAKALGHIGSEARAAVPILRTALEDADDGVRLAAEQALKDIDRRHR
jgi:HEAT repeat protein